MHTILLLLENKKNRDLLTTFLGTHYSILLPENEPTLNVPFDVCLIDVAHLERLHTQVQARKEAERSAFLPIVLIASKSENTASVTGAAGVTRTTQHFWQLIDEVISIPVEKIELQKRVETQLRTRQLSIELQMKNDDIESFIHAMSHDLRAPLRAIQGFSDALVEDIGDQLDTQSRSYLDFIQVAATQMSELIAALLNFSRIGRDSIELYPMSVQDVLEDCVSHLSNDIQKRQANVHIVETSTSVLANPTLLKMVCINLLSNALKFTLPDVAPHVIVTTSCTPTTCRISLQDNGIGISEEHQKRLFAPFVRFHSVEEYSGVGLGLATVRKAVEIMKGQVGVSSTIGVGSTFWIELRSGAVA